MHSAAILQRLEAEFDSPPEHIRAIAELCQAGATPTFIAMFRRDETGNLHETRVTDICQRFAHLSELEERKRAITAALAAGTSSVDLGDVSLEDCIDREFLDDVAHALRPHEQTERRRVAEFGLTDFVEAVHRHELGAASAQEAAAKYVTAVDSTAVDSNVEITTPPAPPSKPALHNTDAVLEIVVRALSERYGEDPLLRRQVRDELSRGILAATATEPGKRGNKGKNGKKGDRRFQEFFDFHEPVRRIAASRMLALRKQEREGNIRVRLDLPEGRELTIYRERFSPDVEPESPLGQLLDLIYRHSYETHVHDACESVVRHDLKEAADRETVHNFARALRAQLLSPPLGTKNAVGLRASSKALWIATIRADGSLGPRHTLGVTDDASREAAAKVLAETITETAPEAIAIPHGRGQPLAQRYVRAAFAHLGDSPPPTIVPVDETAAMVYATSSNGRRSLPGTDTGMRATISLVRRLQDPLRELIHIEPRGLGLGNNLNEVHQGLLTRTLNAIASSCIAQVGIDLNRANTDLLGLIPGLTRDQARTIIEHRNKAGNFAQIADLTTVQSIDEATYEQIAGLLRIYGGSEPLDATGIHPADYPLTTVVAELKGCEVAQLLGANHRDVDLPQLCERASCGRLRALDLLRQLSANGQDPRGEIEALANPDLTTFDDLKLDAEVRGRVTNVTEFGAFLDLGIGIDGLVHISQITGSRLRNPDLSLRVGEILSVYVVSLDPKAKRISLSMHPPRHVADGRQPTIGERMAPNKQRRGRQRRDRGDRTDQPMNRAARAPDGRRGPGRSGPRPPRREEQGSTSDTFRRGGRDGGKHPRGGEREPRIYTIESEREHGDERGHKGELRSLSNLKALFGSADIKSADIKSADIKSSDVEADKSDGPAQS